MTCPFLHNKSLPILGQLLSLRIDLGASNSCCADVQILMASIWARDRKYGFGPVERTVELGEARDLA